MSRRTLCWMLVVSFALLLEAGPSVMAYGSAAAAPATKQGKARIQGFRSAHFGMTEAEVLKAIKTDFNIDKTAVKREINAVEKTTSLSITTTDMIPDSGPTRVGYIFGYKSKKLIQVNLLWGNSVKLESDASALTATASILRGYFLEQGFDKDKIVLDARLEDGTILVFRGADDKGRTILLLLNVPKDRDAEAKQPTAQGATGQASSLRLSYIENITSPDIFKIKKGSF